MDEFADFGGAEKLDDDFGDEQRELEREFGVDDRRERAEHLLVRSADFDELGLGRFAAAARMVARDALELVDELSATRSALKAVTADRDAWRGRRWREDRGEVWPK